MAGIYIHIPFCKQACSYCDFHFSTLLKYKEPVLQAISKELVLQKHFFEHTPFSEEQQKISSVYFGGGTPSLLSASEVDRFIGLIAEHFTLLADAEITLEANPDNLTGTYLKELKRTAINRFSIGVQSFFDEDLSFMRRAHNAQEGLAAIMRAQDAGFENLTIDLIYGFPLLTDVKWRHNLQQTFQLQVPHISAYCLTVEPHTLLEHQIKKGIVSLPQEEQAVQHFQLMCEQMHLHGYEQYEISNFCKPGAYSRHNSNYWLKGPYLGIGPSAHSYNGINRQWNVANNQVYVQQLAQHIIPSEVEVLTPENRYNEYVLTSLRTKWGVSLNKIETDFGSDFLYYFQRELKPFLDKQLVNAQEGVITLTSSGKLIADKIAADLFYV